MKKTLLSIIALAFALSLGVTNISFAAEGDGGQAATQDQSSAAPAKKAKKSKKAKKKGSKKKKSEGSEG